MIMLKIFAVIFILTEIHKIKHIDKYMDIAQDSNAWIKYELSKRKLGMKHDYLCEYLIISQLLYFVYIAVLCFSRFWYIGIFMIASYWIIQWQMKKRFKRFRMLTLVDAYISIVLLFSLIMK